MVLVRRGGQAARGSTDPALLLTRCLGTIDRMAEAMWADEHSRNGRKPKHDWAHEHAHVREKWTRSATAAFLTLLEPCPDPEAADAG